MSDTPGQPDIPPYPGTGRPAGPDAESQEVPDNVPPDDAALPTEMEGRD